MLKKEKWYLKSREGGERHASPQGTGSSRKKGGRGKEVRACALACWSLDASGCCGVERAPSDCGIAGDPPEGAHSGITSAVYFEPFWTYAEPFWAILGHFEPMLTYFDLFWQYFGPLWATLSLSWAILGLFWAILSHFDSLWAPRPCTGPENTERHFSIEKVFFLNIYRKKFPKNLKFF